MATTATDFGAPLEDGRDGGLTAFPVEEETVLRPEESVLTRRIAQLFFATFWLIVFTGSVRKWIFPGSGIFYLLQDVPISLAYVYALYKGFFTRGLLFVGMMLLGAILALQTLLQIVAIDLSPKVGFIGLHHYIYYAPMLLVFPLGLTARYRRDFIRWNLWAAVPMLPLSLVQATSAPSAWVNQSTMGDSFSLPGVDVARISGPFNYTAAYGLWVALAFALCLGEWLLAPERRASKSRSLLLFATGSWALIALISGSRENIVVCAAAAAGACVAAGLIGSARSVAMILVGVMSIPIAVGAVYLINPTEYETMQRRFFDKTNSDYEMKGRVGENLYGWLYEAEFSFIGQGVGMGIDAAHVGSVDAYNFTYGLSESDTVRNVMELGTPVGYLWNFTRMLFALGMIGLAWRLTPLSPHGLPLTCMLFGQVVWDMTRYATTSYTQVMVGYCFVFGVLLYPTIIGVDGVEMDVAPGWEG